MALAAVEMETSIESARALEAGRWRSREASLTAARRDVLGAVVARTRVLLAALSVLGRAEAAEIAAFGRRLDEHGADRDPTAALDAVDRLRRELEARIARPRTTGAAIVGAAARAGVRVEPIDGLWVADLGVPDAADFGLAKAFLDAIAPQTVLLVIEGPPRASLAAALARAEASLVGAGVDPARIAALAVSDPSFREARLTLRVVGYPPP
ncbi:MAG: hypothetical protein H5U40_04575 [Polyangiaceae bacterium]|nr:hypothetical protein [Polyangiaceae bacterium]